MEECVAPKCQSWVCSQMTELQCLMSCHGHHAILCNPNRFIFGDNKIFWYLVVPLNNSASMSNCPLVQIKSISPPPEVCACVCVCVCGGGKSLFHDFTSIFNIHKYANEIILYMTIGWKDLSNCITDDIITCNKDSLYLFFFYNFPLFSEICTSIDEYAN